MKVMKFGGTSVGTPQRMKDVVQLITDGEQNLVVSGNRSFAVGCRMRIGTDYKLDSKQS